MALPHYDVAVIGGGPAGMMAAGRAAELGARVVLLEKNPSLGKKLLISGGGRCNILCAEFDTHKLVERYGKKGKSLFSTFSQFDAQETWDFFESCGIPLKVEAEQRAFPRSDKAEDVKRALVSYMERGGVRIVTDCAIRSIVSSDGLIKKIVHDSGFIQARNYILATGGKSRPETGSTGDGFLWTKELGHSVTEPAPALVPLTIRNPWVKEVAGISLKDVKVTVWQGKKKHESRIGKMLFTHVGVSGPVILNMSKGIGRLLSEGEVMLSIDLFPSLDAGAMDRKVMEVFDRGKNKMIKNNIGDLLQPRLGRVALDLAGIDPTIPLHQLRREDRRTFAELLKNFPMSVSGLLGEDKAVVTGGGVDLNEVEFKTMRSKILGNLFLAGDILDFDRPSGGFSLQICWTTGFVAGTSAVQSDERTVQAD